MLRMTAPKKDRHKKKTVSWRLPQDILDQLAELSDRTRRTQTMEVVIALEKHLEDSRRSKKSDPAD